METYLYFLRETAKEETEFQRLHCHLLSLAPKEEHKNILTGIRNDCEAQKKLICRLGFQESGKPLRLIPPQSHPLPAAYEEALSLAYMRTKRLAEQCRNVARHLSNVNQAMTLGDMAAELFRHQLLYLYLKRS